MSREEKIIISSAGIQQNLLIERKASPVSFNKIIK
jgi:hypothetical protein